MPLQFPIEPAGLGGQKFGVQAKKAAVVKLFRNGDKHHNGETFTVNTKTIHHIHTKVSFFLLSKFLPMKVR